VQQSINLKEKTLAKNYLKSGVIMDNGLKRENRPRKFGGRDNENGAHDN